jgi:hypothetical protein
MVIPAVWVRIILKAAWELLRKATAAHAERQQMVSLKGGSCARKSDMVFIPYLRPVWENDLLAAFRPLDWHLGSDRL